MNDINNAVLAPSEEYMIEINEDLKIEARSLLAQGKQLPAELSEFPGAYVATHEDKSIQACASVEFGGLFYKIGFKKSERVQR
jgi:hypothetical protein